MPPRHHKPPPKPPLTHFLCIPLLTPTSTPQLKASLAHLKTTIDSIGPAPQIEEEEKTDAPKNPSDRPRGPLIPPTAFRPLGTLHLTLGVMSLKDPGKLAAALELLQYLDLEGMLREVSESHAESSTTNVASSKSLQDGQEDHLPPSQPPKRNSERDRDSNLPSFPITASSARDNNSISQPDRPRTGAEAVDSHTSSPPSLTKPITPPPLSNPTHFLPPRPPPPLTISLHTLHTFPQHQPQKATVLHTAPHDATSRLYPFCLRLVSAFGEAGYLLARGHGNDENDGKERELTLHATLINTVYAKGPRGRGGSKRMTFDAREILRRFNDGVGRDRKATTTTTTTTTSSIPAKEKDESPNTPTSPQDPTQTGQPYTFAHAIAINSVQICEMGAKRLDPEADLEGLGQKYRVVGEKRIVAPRLEWEEVVR